MFRAKRKYAVQLTPAERKLIRFSLMELRNIPDVNQVDYRIRTAADQAVRARRQEDR